MKRLKKLQQHIKSHHKEWIIKHSKTHPAYSKFLEEKAYWYERDLRLYRNKVIAHGGTLTSGMSVSPHTGIGFIRSVGISPLQGEDKDDFLRIKRTYETRDPRIKILENDYEMLNDFVLAITQYDVRLDDPDLICLGKIIQTSGVRVNVYYLESIAKHIEDFLQETASIFK